MPRATGRCYPHCRRRVRGQLTGWGAAQTGGEDRWGPCNAVSPPPPRYGYLRQKLLKNPSASRAEISAERDPAQPASRMTAKTPPLRWGQRIPACAPPQPHFLAEPDLRSGCLGEGVASCLSGLRLAWGSAMPMRRGQRAGIYFWRWVGAENSLRQLRLHDSLTPG